MTEPIEQLAARVAGLMGLKKEIVSREYSLLTEHFFTGSYIDAAGRRWESSLHHPAEVFRLCAEFNAWPVNDGGEMAVWMYGVDPVFAPHDNTPESRQQAATRAVLMAIEQILKEKQA